MAVVKPTVLTMEPPTAADEYTAKVIGWTVNEDATPIVVGDSSGSIGSFNAVIRPDSGTKFLGQQGVHLTDEALGDVSGIVTKVNINGTESANLDMIPHLNNFSVSRNIPTVHSGSPIAALDAAALLTGDTRCMIYDPYARYWSLQGHSVGILADFNPQSILKPTDYTTYKTEYVAGVAAGDYTTPDYAIRDSVMGYDWNFYNDYIWSRNVQGYSPRMQEVGAYTMVMWKGCITLGGATQTFTIQGGPDDIEWDLGKTIQVVLDRTAATVTTSVIWPLGGSITSSVTVLPLTLVNLAGEYIIKVESHFVNNTDLQVDVSIANTASITSVESSSLVATGTNGIDSYYTSWAIYGGGASGNGNARAVMTKDSYYPFTFPTVDYEAPRFYDLGPGLDPGFYSPIVGGNFNVWDYLKQVFSACTVELTVVNGQPTLQPLATLKIDATQRKSPVQLTYDDQTVSYALDVINHRTSILNAIGSIGGEDQSYKGRIYQATSSYTVGAGEVSRYEAIEVEGYPTLILQPKPIFGIANWDYQSPFGVYCVMDSEGEPILPRDWITNGGAVQVTLNANPGYIDITLIGPSEEISGYTGPYSLGIGRQAGNINTLSVAARGAGSDPETLRIYSGADPAVAQEEVGSTIDNVALTTRDRVWNRGFWAAAHAAGGMPSASFDISTSHIAGWGLTIGSTFSHMNTNYRVNSATIDKGNTSVDAEFFTTCDDFDARWLGQTCAQFTSYWTRFKARDIKKEPLR